MQNEGVVLEVVPPRELPQETRIFPGRVQRSADRRYVVEAADDAGRVRKVLRKAHEMRIIKIW